MGHRCCSKQKVKRGLWSPEEDEKLLNFITCHGHSSWSSVPRLAGLERCGKSCRLRWINYLRPDLRRGSFTEEEERTIIEVHRILGNRWAQIAKHLPGRTDNEVKNFWNSCIKKKLLAHGFDPNTHNLLPPPKLPSTCNTNSKNTKTSPKKMSKKHMQGDHNSPADRVVFTVDMPIRSHKKDNPALLMPQVDVPSHHAPPDATPAATDTNPSTFGLSFMNNISTTSCVTNGFGLMDPPSVDMSRVDSGLERFHVDDQAPHQVTTAAAHHLQLQADEINNNIQGMEELSELQMLKRLQMGGQSFDIVPPYSNINGGSAFDFGFGDYDAIIQSGMYGDVVASMDQLAWDDIAN